MSDKRYLGNIITDTPTAPANNTTNTPAPGVWSLSEALFYTKAGLWPNAANLAPRGLFAAIDQSNNGTYAGIEKIEIGTTGNSTDYGDLSVSRNYLGSCSSSTRAVFVGGSTVNTMDYVEFATAGNASDFGDLGNTAAGANGAGNATRGIVTRIDDIYYFTIASTGNSSTFGNWGENRSYGTMTSNSTRAVIAGGSSGQQTMDYVTIASTGSQTSFGSISGIYTRDGNGVVSSSTRGIFAGGYDSNVGGQTNKIAYITIASTGNGTDFGDLTVARSDLASCSSTVRGTFAGGAGASKFNTIDYITIASTGNASDFGDLSIAEAIGITGCSNSHGGIA
ncbi:MAG: hypothetical protein CMJ25_01315 [Phycisphaerae bacterium]|nr:hypothetical protein [Phycisphaerae bacterium]|tara:strand:+ start:2085 stop:3095 length:1011 start_codon:yes stop_codon:yes gene_type:complete